MSNSNNSNRASPKEELCKMTIETNNIVIETKGLSELSYNKTPKGKNPRFKMVPVLIPVIEEDDSNSDELNESYEKSEMILPDIGTVTLETPKNIHDLSAYKPISDADCQFSAINVLHESPVENNASSSLKFSPQTKSFYLMSKSGLSKSKVTLPPRMTLPNFSMSNLPSSSTSQHIKNSSIQNPHVFSKYSHIKSNSILNPSIEKDYFQFDRGNRANDSFDKRFMKILPKPSKPIKGRECSDFQSFSGSNLVQAPRIQCGSVEQNKSRHVGPNFLTIQKVHKTYMQKNNKAKRSQSPIINLAPETGRQLQTFEPPIPENILLASLGAHQNATTVNKSALQTVTSKNASSTKMTEVFQNQIQTSETSNTPRTASAKFPDNSSLTDSVYKEIKESNGVLSVQITRSYSRKKPVVSKITNVKTGETVAFTDPTVLPNTYFVNLSHGTDSNSAVVSNFTPVLKNVPENQKLVDCPLCIYKVTSQGKLKKHMKIHHLIDKMEKFPSYVEILKKRRNVDSFTVQEMLIHYETLKDILLFKTSKNVKCVEIDSDKSKSSDGKTLPTLTPSPVSSINIAPNPDEMIVRKFPTPNTNQMIVKKSPTLVPCITNKLNNRNSISAFSKRSKKISRTIQPRTNKILKFQQKNQTTQTSTNVLSTATSADKLTECISQTDVPSTSDNFAISAESIHEIQEVDNHSNHDSESEEIQEFETDPTISDESSSDYDEKEGKIEKRPKPRYKLTDLSPDTYFCTRCHFTTEDLKEFAIHRESHYHPLQCPFCRIVSYGKDQLKLHMQGVHDTVATWNAQNDLVLRETNNNSEEILEPVVVKESDHKLAPDFITIEYHCQACGFNSVNYSEYLEHVKADHVKTCYCASCGKMFNHEILMVEHLRFCSLEDKYKHTSEKTHKTDSGPYNCYICDYVCDNKKKYIFHMGSIHNALRYFCVFCNVGFHKKVELVTHYKGNHLLGCRLCKLEFSNTIELWAHRQTHEKKLSFVCEECGKVMRNKAYFKDHLNWHRGIKTHTCKFCGEMFSIYDALVGHRQRKHSDQINTSFLCNFCGIQYKFKNALYQHVRTVHENKTGWATQRDPSNPAIRRISRGPRSKRRIRDPRTGYLVDRSDLIKNNIKPTIRVRDPVTGQLVYKTNQKPNGTNRRRRTFLCRHCGIGFSRMAELREHKDVHELISDFQCDHCGLYFVSQTNLNTHFRMKYCRVFGEKKRVRPPRKKMKMSEEDSEGENSTSATTSHANQNVEEPQPVVMLQSEASTSREYPETIIRYITSPPKKAFLASSSTQTSRRILNSEIGFAVDSVLQAQNIHVPNSHTRPESVSNYIIVSEANQDEYPALNYYTEFG